MDKIVNFRVAQLLKQTGFDKPCLWCFLSDGTEQCSSGDMGDTDEYNHNEWDNFSAPTISQVIWWIYETFGIWIEVRKLADKKTPLFKPYTADNDFIDKYKEVVFCTEPIGAYEFAIEAFLLIKI